MTAGDDDFRQWLEALGLGRYAGVFADNHVGFEVLRLLSDADLQALGMSSLGHRRRLQDALGQLPPRRAAPMPGDHGERRQITVMFCDLVGSTELSVSHEGEDFRRLIKAYRSSCCTLIEESGGFIARVVGDGILAYFGYPAASEDAAECAIRAGLRITESVKSAPPHGGSRIDVRIGLATGVSVVGDMVGPGYFEPHAVTGQVPNLAARVQALAEPGMVAI